MPSDKCSNRMNGMHFLQLSIVAKNRHENVVFRSFRALNRWSAFPFRAKD